MNAAIAMAKTDFKSVDEYIAAQPDAAQVVLERVRSTIRRALPGAEEVISYNMPTYKVHGRPVLYFAGWKQHYSLYPATSVSSLRSRTSLHLTRSRRGQSDFHS